MSCPVVQFSLHSKHFSFLPLRNRPRGATSAAAIGRAGGVESSVSKGRVESSAARGRVESSITSGEKKKVKLMEGKVAEEVLGNGNVDPTESIVTVGKKKNFFDFEEIDTDVWGPKFTTTLRKSRWSGA